MLLFIRLCIADMDSPKNLGMYINHIHRLPPPVWRKFYGPQTYLKSGNGENYGKLSFGWALGMRQLSDAFWIPNDRNVYKVQTLNVHYHLSFLCMNVVVSKATVFPTIDVCSLEPSLDYGLASVPLAPPFEQKHTERCVRRISISCLTKLASDS